MSVLGGYVACLKHQEKLVLFMVNPSCHGVSDEMAVSGCLTCVMARWHVFVSGTQPYMDNRKINLKGG